jgi:hypothetical protein
VRLGPTSAASTPRDATLVYDAGRWRVDQEGDDLLVTNLGPRLTPCERFRTGVRGRVVTPGRLLLAS